MEQANKGAIGEIIEATVTPQVVVTPPAPAKPADGGTTVVVNPPAPAPAPAAPHSLPQTQPGVNLP